MAQSISGSDTPVGTPCSGGICFSPCPDGGTYKSLFDHRGNRHDASRWSDEYPPPAEFLLFCTSFIARWSDAAGHYWAVDDHGKRRLGTRGERLAKFPANGNPATVEWHGFPASPQLNGTGSAPPDDFVEAWILAHVVSRGFGRKIQKRKI